MELYDLIIIGAGPAGITASVYAVRKKMKFLVISKDVGGQTLWTNNIENYTGYLFITGIDLVEKFSQHLDTAGISALTNTEIADVVEDQGTYMVSTSKGQFNTKSIIIASGRVPRRLGIKGEEVFLNKGVAYCATCDAPLFAGKVVAVVGGGNAALDAVAQLLPIATHIHIFDAEPAFRADPVLIEKARASGKVTEYHGAAITEISGKVLVQGIVYVHQGVVHDLAVEGVFIEAGSLPATGFIQDIEKNETGEIIVNCACQTSRRGIFAAGDCTSVPAKQIIIACGEGAKAAISAFNYCTTLP